MRYWELAFIAAGSTPAQSEGYRVVEWLEEKYAYVIHCEIEYIFVWSARLVVLTSFEYVTLYFILCTASQITRRHIEYKIYFFYFLYTCPHKSEAASLTNNKAISDDWNRSSSESANKGSNLTEENFHQTFAQDVSIHLKKNISPKWSLKLSVMRLELRGSMKPSNSLQCLNRNVIKVWLWAKAEFIFWGRKRIVIPLHEILIMCSLSCVPDVSKIFCWPALN